MPTIQSNDDYDSASSYSECLTGTSGNTSFQSIPSLSETLEQQFSDVPKNFNVIHINAQSIPAHFSDMLVSLNNKNIHAILISESWLKPCLHSSCYTLPGFTLIRNDRTSGGGGGVAIYLRSHISYSIVSTSCQPPPSNAGEHLFIEISLTHTKILLGVYYCPSLRISFFSSFESLLEDFLPTYNHAIIMGDFNTCLLKNDSRTSSFNSILHACNISALPLNATHFYPNSTPSLLDLILVSSTAHVAKHGQCAADSFSYHDLIFVSYKIRPPKPKPRILLQRNFGGMNLTLLREDARKIDWTSLYNASYIDEQIGLFNSHIERLYDLHAPIRPIKIKHIPAPWLSKEIRSLMDEKAAAKSRYKKQASDENKATYLICRNRCNRVCRDAQRRHIHTSIENGDPGKIWKFLRTLGVGKPRQNSVPNDLDLGLINNHFSSSCSSCLNGTDKLNTLSQLVSVPTPDQIVFVFNQLTACEVRKSILSIASNAVGNDNISRNMIIPILDEILPIITFIFNKSLSSAVFPSIWKDAQIIPLPKKNKPSSYSDYRPISILPFLSKALERLVHNQLNYFLNQNSLLNPFQSGFRPGHSTTTALVKITDDVRLGMENRNLTVLTLLDFSNAFNTIDFDVLLALLLSLNLSPTVVDWFKSYLSGRRQRVRVDDSLSSWCTTSAGVPQGGVLSPLLFAIFINSISNKLTSPYHLYADDLQIYTQAPLADLNRAIETTNCNLKHISQWSRSYGLVINPTKTQVIVIGSQKLVTKIDWLQLPQVIFEGTRIPFSERVKNLGIFINRNLTWVSQINEVSRKIFASAASLRRLRNFLPIATKVALAQSLLFPILDYADVSYLDITEDQLNKIERLQNLCIRFIFGLRKFDHISEFRKKLKWLPVRLRRNAHILSLLYSILFNPASPAYLKDRFRYLHSTHSLSLRSSENLRLETPSHSTRFYDKSFSVQAVKLWNALPLTIRQSKNINIFKTHIYKHFLSLY